MILKNDLAMLYFPNLAPRGARLQLIRYIKENHTLSRELCQAGYDSRRKNCYFTPLQVEIIKKHLGEPWQYGHYGTNPQPYAAACTNVQQSEKIEPTPFVSFLYKYYPNPISSKRIGVMRFSSSDFTYKAE